MPGWYKVKQLSFLNVFPKSLVFCPELWIWIYGTLYFTELFDHESLLQWVSSVERPSLKLWCLFLLHTSLELFSLMKLTLTHQSPPSFGSEFRQPMHPHLLTLLPLSLPNSLRLLTDFVFVPFYFIVSSLKQECCFTCKVSGSSRNSLELHSTWCIAGV